MGDVQERIIQDAVAARVARANHAELSNSRAPTGISKRCTSWPTACAQGRAGKLWPRIAQALIDADFA